MKMPNGYGSVYKLQGNRRKPWTARKTIGWKIMEDKERPYPEYEFIGYYATRAEALQALAKYNEDPDGMKVEQTTFSELYVQWSKSYFPKLKETAHYERAFRLCKKLHGMQISDIKLGHLQRVVDESGKNIQSLQRVKNLVGLMFDYAVRREMVTADRREMVRFVDLSAVGNPNAIERAPFSLDEINWLWSHMETDGRCLVPLVMIYTGLRIGELLALDCTDVHLSERWLHVRESKTAAGIRNVPIAEKIAPIFKKWMRDSGPLVRTADDVRMTYQRCRRSSWKPLMTDAGMTHRTHDARHTCVSLLVQAGVDERIVKQIVGHSGKSVTDKVYTHVGMDKKLEAINMI